MGTHFLIDGTNFCPPPPTVGFSFWGKVTHFFFSFRTPFRFGKKPRNGGPTVNLFLPERSFFPLSFRFGPSSWSPPPFRGLIPLSRLTHCVSCSLGFSSFLRVSSSYPFPVFYTKTKKLLRQKSPCTFVFAAPPLGFFAQRIPNRPSFDLGRKKKNLPVPNYLEISPFWWRFKLSPKNPFLFFGR